MRKSMIALMIVIILIIIVAVMLSTSPTTPKSRAIKEKWEIADLDWDEYQLLIYELVSEVHPIDGVPFITYEYLGGDGDSFYERVYLYAMIDGIDSELNVHHSYTYPFAFVYDRQGGELIRSYFPYNPDLFDIVAYENNFPFEIQGKITLDPISHIDRVDKLHYTNIWNAMNYFEIPEEDDEYLEYE